MHRMHLPSLRKTTHLIILLGLLYSLLPAGGLEVARARVPAKPQQANIKLDGVQISVQASVLPSQAFAVAEPGSASQVATSASWKPFSELTITAIPFGTTPGTEALPIAGPGEADAYIEALRTYREGQQASISEGPQALLFGQQVTALQSLVRVNIDSPTPRPVVIDEWVVEAGHRLWLVRSSQQQVPGDLSAQAGTQGMSIGSGTLDAPSTLKAQPAAIASASPDTGVDASALPTPAWWHGDCDYDTYYAGSGGRGSYRLGEVYLGMPACGPRPYSDKAPDVLVRFYSGSWGEYEWECVELAMRFLYLKYSINPYQANGSQVVWNYSGTRLVKIANGTANKAPVPNDILSYGSTSTAGHASVVTSSSVDGNGNGSITVIEQNSAASGKSTLSVSNWTVAGNAGSVSGWLHDAKSDATPTPTSTATPAVTPTPTYVPTPGPGTGPAFSDNFDRADGAVGNGWLAWANPDHDPSADLLGSQLRTFGYPQLAGGIERNLLITFPITFSFDFRTENFVNGCGLSGYNDAGWRITFNSADSATPNTAAAQLKLEQYAGSLNLIRRYLTSSGATDESGMAQDAAPLTAGQRDYGTALAHIDGAVLGDLSTRITIHYNDGQTPDPISINLGPAAGAVNSQPGPMLMLANSNCSSGPHYFDNLQVKAYTTHTISGDAGAPGVTLSYFDIVARTATADASGNYSLQVSDGWSGTVKPSASGATFTPGSRSYSNVTTDKIGQNYQAVFKKTFYSSGAQDGWVLESSETSGQGGTLDSSGSTFRMGDAANDAQYRSILSFNTSSLPDNAVITSATLKIRKQGVTGTNPFKTHGSLLADLRKGSFSGSSTLQIEDFQATSTLNAALSFANSPVSGWYSQALGSAGLGYINLKGYTQFRLRFSKQDNDDLSADYLSCYSGNAGSSNRPKLILQYYVP